MSVVAPSGERAELPRPPTVEDVWLHAFEEWSRDNRGRRHKGRLRNLAILMLYNHHWTQPDLAAVFGVTQGRISQILDEVTSSLRVSYTKHAHNRRETVPDPQLLLFDDYDDDDETGH